MDLLKKKNELIEKISMYLKGNLDLSVLNEFSWEVIDYFSNKEKSSQIPIEEFENEFWYAIWQIQMLADSSHEKEGVTRREFKKTLDFLKKRKRLPSGFYGARP